MQATPLTRRRFLRWSAGSLAGAFVPYLFWPKPKDAPAPPPTENDFRIAVVGPRHQGAILADNTQAHGRIVALCDVDRQVAEAARERFAAKAALFEDYRKMLDQKEIDVVLIAAPDHWHTAIASAACQAGKDVYCEKPLTLTIDEGKLLCKVVQQTGRVFQVGTWQRSDARFRLAVEMVRQGRIGKLQKITVVLGTNRPGGPFRNEPVPSYLNWDLWLGQAPKVDYCPERCHNTFRYWYEYAGGQMTDWGAHHMDIAHWAMGMEYSGPVEVESKGELPDIPNGYTVPTTYSARLVYPNGVDVEVFDSGRNGLLFEGSEGRIFVNRGTLAGKPVDALKDHPFPPDKYKLYPHDNLSRPPQAAHAGEVDGNQHGNFLPIRNHLGNFFDCVKSRQKPISDVVSQHRAITTCHLVNISIRLGRKLKWDPQNEVIFGDDEANRWLSRQQREGYEIRV